MRFRVVGRRGLGMRFRCAGRMDSLLSRTFGHCRRMARRCRMIGCRRVRRLRLIAWLLGVPGGFLRLGRGVLTLLLLAALLLVPVAGFLVWLVAFALGLSVLSLLACRCLTLLLSLSLLLLHLLARGVRDRLHVIGGMGLVGLLRLRQVVRGGIRMHGLVDLVLAHVRLSQCRMGSQRVLARLMLRSRVVLGLMLTGARDLLFVGQNFRGLAARRSIPSMHGSLGFRCLSMLSSRCGFIPRQASRRRTRRC